MTDLASRIERLERLVRRPSDSDAYPLVCMNTDEAIATYRVLYKREPLVLLSSDEMLL